VYTTGTERGKNKPDDTDVTLYSLGKWAGLACKGNPSVLHFLFAKPEYQTLEWCQVTQDPIPFLAKSHLSAFFGFANAQLNRLYNARGPKDISRPFLESQHGYDTKYAMHIIRLVGEAKELMEDGKITLPRPNAVFLREIREGKIKLYEIEKLADEMMREAKTAQDRSSLPERPDRKEISRRIARAYRDRWDRKSLDAIEQSVVNV
jgi:predicted nucleotidyltransferase